MAHLPDNNEGPAGEEVEISDEDLFNQPPPREECVVCVLPLPLRERDQQYFACCGKTICRGCVLADARANNREICPFCRASNTKTDGQLIERLTKRIELHDGESMVQLAGLYGEGDAGLQQDHDNERELLMRAGELGCAWAFYKLGLIYEHGEGVAGDIGKATHYYKLAAVAGDHRARYTLGMLEGNAGNGKAAVKHFLISAGVGDDDSLKAMRTAYQLGYATKDEFEKALRTHKEAKDRMVSEQREEARIGDDTREAVRNDRPITLDQYLTL